MADLVLKNGRVVTPTAVIRGGVVVAGGKVVSAGPDASLGKGHQEIDLQGKVVFPGLFDPHVHLGMGDTIGEERMRSDFETETKDAALGGVTTFSTTSLMGSGPLVEQFERSRNCGQGRSYIDYHINTSVMTREHCFEIPQVFARGGASYKFFWGYKGIQAQGFGLSEAGFTPDLFYLACRSLAQCGPPALAAIHAEDPWIRELLAEEIRRQGRKDLLTAWAEHSPDYAESIQLYAAAMIAHPWGVPLYPVHVSAAHTVDTIQGLLRQGVRVIGETVGGFLATTAPEADARGLGPLGKIQPPIRFERDKERLWRGLQEGSIRVVGTDTVPYSRAFKTAVDFWDSRVGLNNYMNATLSLMLTEGYHKGRLGLVELAKALSENGCRAFGLYPRKGAIQPGADADLVVIDLERETRLGLDKKRGSSDYCIWEGVAVKGVPVMTFVRGQLVAQDGEIVAERPLGSFIPHGRAIF